MIWEGQGGMQGSGGRIVMVGTTSRRDALECVSSSSALRQRCTRLWLQMTTALSSGGAEGVQSAKMCTGFALYASHYIWWYRTRRTKGGDWRRATILTSPPYNQEVRARQIRRGRGSNLTSHSHLATIHRKQWSGDREFENEEVLDGCALPKTTRQTSYRQSNHLESIKSIPPARTPF
jgi:hypothetical protein